MAPPAAVRPSAALPKCSGVRNQVGCVFAGLCVVGWILVPMPGHVDKRPAKAGAHGSRHWSVEIRIGGSALAAAAAQGAGTRRAGVLRTSGAASSAGQLHSSRGSSSSAHAGQCTCVLGFKAHTQCALVHTCRWFRGGLKGDAAQPRINPSMRGCHTNRGQAQRWADLARAPGRHGRHHCWCSQCRRAGQRSWREGCKAGHRCAPTHTPSAAVTACKVYAPPVLTQAAAPAAAQ